MPKEKKYCKCGCLDNLKKEYYQSLKEYYKYTDTMGKLRCICDNILSDTCGNDAEAFTEGQTIRVDINETDGYEDDVYVSGDGRGILECEKCGAIAIEDPINSNHVQFYIPENKKFNNLFRGEL